MRIHSVQAGFSFENLMWIFTRLSGLGIILMGLTGFIIALFLGARTQVDLPTLMRWTFFPNPNHVVNSEIPDLTLGWSNAFWQVMQILIVLFGASHGLNGLRVVLEDYLSLSAIRLIIRSIIFLLWLSILIIAIYVILTS